MHVLGRTDPGVWRHPTAGEHPFLGYRYLWLRPYGGHLGRVLHFGQLLQYTRGS
jgi:hypothetical protein